ncbi:restriction endonuclease [candidate division TA06 bacterium DG_26]|uniref:Restriction endonuclease n=1 Tax=candidate division TA06 bacterium DG_26 TaxID=1703771 RepID=A0A0S7WK54_UNCT6|nr:MAG: restriction endonuclease [candidate division TA06 bacterium DG_26]
MIPGFQSVMLPLLKYAGDSKEHHIRDAIETLGEVFKLTEQEQKELLPSGQGTFDNRVAWAKTYLTKAGLLRSTKRGHFRITERGTGVLENPPDAVNIKFLSQYPEFIEFRGPSRGGEEEGGGVEPPALEDKTPEELMEIGYRKLETDLISRLLDQLRQCSPSFFEKLVVDLLVKMGYGGSREDAGRAVGRSGDEGIDGMIKEDKLGLDAVYIQAKKWGNLVSRPEIQKFAGALQGQRARKGIFITTSTFSESAKEYVSRIDSKIVLIDGEQLAKLMIEYGVGVSNIASYEIRDLDLDYFLGQ